MCTPCVRCPWKPEEGVRAPGSGVSGGCGWWESILGPSQEQQRGHWNKTQVNRGHFCWDSFQCQLLGYRYRCYLRYTACVHTWLPLPNSFLICQVEITTASLLGALGQLREMVPIKPLTYGCRMSASESLLWNELLYSVSLIKDITIASLRMTFFIINSIVNAWVLFSPAWGVIKCYGLNFSPLAFFGGCFPSIQVPQQLFYHSVRKD